MTGVAHLHKLEVVHGNIRPVNLNLCVQDHGRLALKICDIITSKRPIGRMDAGTPTEHSYRAPELFTCRTVTTRAVSKPSDMWSVGCVLWELCFGDVAFMGANAKEVASMMERQLGRARHRPCAFWRPAGSDQEPNCTPAMNDMRAGEGREALAGGMEIARRCLMWAAGCRISAFRCQRTLFCISGGDSGQPVLPPQLAAAATASGLTTTLPGPSVQSHRRSSDTTTSERRRGNAMAVGDVLRVKQLLGPARKHRLAHARTPALTSVVEAGAEVSACKCPGNCQNKHAKGQACTRSPGPPNSHAVSTLCSMCCCDVAGCGLPRFRGKCCFSHAYMNLNIVFRVIRHASITGLLNELLPQDVKEFLLAKSTTLHEDEALLLIAAWIMEPAAIRSLVTHRPRSNTYSALELYCCLQQVWEP